MKRFLMILLCFMLLSSAAWADVIINAQNFPDEIFRYAVSILADTNSDNVLSDSEIAERTAFRFNGLGISSLKGIEYFTGLQILYCYENNLTELDLSRNTELVSLKCGSNDLTALDLSNNTKLNILSCDNAKLETLNVRGNRELMMLSCKDNRIKALDLRDCENLLQLLCDGNNLSSLDLSGNEELYNLNCESNDLTSINLSNNPELMIIDCDDNKLTAIDLSGNSKLRAVTCSHNQLTKLDVSMCPDLEYLFCYDNKIETLTANPNGKLSTVMCMDNQLKYLDFRNLKTLTTLMCDFNFGLVSLDLSGCTSLNSLDCMNCNLNSINITGCEALTRISCLYNSLKSLDLTQCTNLTKLNCGGNSITELDLTRCSELVSLDCYSNRISTLNLRSNSKLRRLSCYNNILSELDLSGNRSLEELVYHSNEISAIDLSGLPYLSYDKLSSGASIQSTHTKNISRVSDKEDPYPYRVNLNDYMPSASLSGIDKANIHVFDDDKNKISHDLEAGIIKMSAAPVCIRYFYDTGFRSSGGDPYLMQVEIIDSDFLTLSRYNHVYRIIQSPMSWQNAKTYCESIGGHLATITNNDELEVLKELYSNFDFNGTALWAGGLKVNDSWEWITSEDFTGKVEAGEGFNSKNEAMYDLEATLHGIDFPMNYLMITPEGELSSWNGIFQSSFICEWDSEPSNFAPLNPEYQRYISDPEAYFEGREFHGGIPEPLDLSHLKSNPPIVSSNRVNASDTLPAKYDPRESGITFSARDQGNYHTCWSFATIGALETNYIIQNGGGDAPDLSELHQAWFVYKDPRPSWREPLYSEEQSILNQGGNNVKSIAFLSRAGTASETILPYDRATDNDDENAGLITAIYPEDYNHPIKLREAYLIGAVTSENRQEIKELVKKHGAVAIDYYAQSLTGRSGDCYYLDSGDAYGHMADIIGWDDNYSRDNFKNKPKSNGAWLIKNSYLWNSFFWMSYEQEISSAAVYIADMSGSSTSTLYGHDTIDARDSVAYNWSMSMFRTSSRETINEIAFHTRNNNIHYEIYIKRYGTTEPDNPGVPPEALVLEGGMPYFGYHTVTLNEPVELEAGEYFAVMIKLDDTQSNYRYSSAVADAGEIVRASSITTAGKSYFAMTDDKPVSSDWKDGKRLIDGTTERSCNACIKVIATSDIPVNITTTRLASGTTGRNYSYTLSASGSGITWTVTGLPDGLRLNGNTITGTPSTSGTYSITITAEDSRGRTDTETLQLVIEESSPSNSNEESEGGSGGGGCNTGLTLAGLTVIIMLTKKKR